MNQLELEIETLKQQLAEAKAEITFLKTEMIVLGNGYRRTEYKSCKLCESKTKCYFNPYKKGAPWCRPCMEKLYGDFWEYDWYDMLTEKYNKEKPENVFEYEDEDEDEDLEDEEEDKDDEEEEEEEDEHEEVDDYDDEYGYYNRNGGDYKRPVVTINVAEMIEALNKLPPDAKLVMTETGYYSRREFARILLPKPYIVGTNKMGETDLPKGTQVYCIGHSHQTY